MESFAQIRTWVSTLTQLFGDPRPLIDQKPLQKLHAEARYIELVEAMVPGFGLPTSPTIELAESGGPPGACAWVTFKTRSFLGLFPHTTAQVSIHTEFLARAPFAVMVSAIAHELSHIALWAKEHSLNKEEKVVDLLAMFFGYRGIWQTQFAVDEVVHCRVWTPDMSKPLVVPLVQKAPYETSYLTEEEIIYAKMLMQI
jgi:hypothetical protein